MGIFTGVCVFFLDPRDGHFFNIAWKASDRLRHSVALVESTIDKDKGKVKKREGKA